LKKKVLDNVKSKSLFGSFVFLVIFIGGVASVYLMYRDSTVLESNVVGISSLILGLPISSAIRIADPWGKQLFSDKVIFIRLNDPGYL
jgi:hypothetical protein